MKKALVAVLAVTVLAAGSLAGCDDDFIRINVSGERGSGNLETREMDVSGFTGVEAGPAFEIKIVQSDAYSVAITTDDNLIEEIQVSTRGETLEIGITPGSHDFTTLKAEITMPDLYALDLSAATHCTVSGFSFLHDFTVKLSAASSLEGDITAGDVEFALSAASRVELRGSAMDAAIEVSGASVAALADFSLSSAKVDLSGASRGTVKLDGRLDADLSGASTLEFIGEPTLGDIDISGASFLTRR